MRNSVDSDTLHIVHTFETDSVMLSFGDKRVLRNIYVKVETGRVTGLVGRNGSGKSCLMRIMHGSLYAPDKSVRIDGRWVARAYTEGVVYLPQHNFIPAARSIKNVMRDYGLDFDRLVSYFPSLEKHWRYSVGMLSGGERRVLETWVVLASESLFCLLDEPLSQLSPLNIEVIKNMIRE